MKKIGFVSVDSGTLLIGDPCYWLNNKQYQKEMIKNNFNYRTIKHEKGYKGKGIITSTGYGDGLYEVWAEIKDNRVSKIEINFME